LIPQEVFVSLKRPHHEARIIVKSVMMDVGCLQQLNYYQTLMLLDNAMIGKKERDVGMPMDYILVDARCGRCFKLTA
jgi:hypothetical protein